MAASSCATPQREHFYSLNDENFETTVKRRMFWTNAKWEEAGEENSRIRKLINSLKYWGKKLKTAQGPTNVILTVFNESRDAHVSLEHIVDAILNLDEDITIRGYADFRNPRYVSFAFANEQTKIFVETHLKYVDGNNVAFLNWAEEPLEKLIRVHWLDNDIDIDLVKNELEKYFTITEENKVITPLLNGTKLESAKINFKGILKKGCNIEDVPHLTMINGLESLITVMGRQYLCLTCERVGHKAKDCPTPYCQKCKDLKKKKHECELVISKPSTYAQKLRGVNAVIEDQGKREAKDNSVIIAKEKKILKLSNTMDCTVDVETRSSNGSVAINDAEVVKGSTASEPTLINDKVLKETTGETNVVAGSGNSENFNKADNISGSDEENWEGSGMEEDDENNSSSDSIVLSEMQNHLRELNQLESLVKVQSGDMVKLKNKQDKESKQDQKLKRKIDNPSIFGDEVHRSGARRTYTRRGRGRIKVDKNEQDFVYKEIE